MDNNREKKVLDVVSGIDEEIIEKNTKKRATLFLAMKKRMKKIWILRGSALAASLAAIFGAVMLMVTLLTKQVPIYTGMTVSNTAPGTTVAAVNLPQYNSSGKNDFNGHYNNGEKPNPDDIQFGKPLKDSLNVIGSAASLYYAKPNQDIYITIHLDNPDDFVILSFTFNGQMYSSYMFEKGSDMENIIIKVNVGNAEGFVDYTIDAIKYVEKTEIKDVEMRGEKTVRVAVYPEGKQPTAAISGALFNYNTVSFGVSTADELGLVGLSGGKMEAVLYDGESIVARKDIAAAGTETVTFGGLRSGTAYSVSVVAYYDTLDGSGVGSYVLSEKKFYTPAVVLFDNARLGDDSICFSLAWGDNVENKVLLSLALYQGEEKVKDLDVTATTVNGLIPGRVYSLVATYQNGNVTESIRLGFEIDSLSYTVNHYFEKLEGGYELVKTVHDTIDLGATIMLPVMQRVGYTAPTPTAITGEIGKTLTVDYHYTINVHNVTYRYNNGESDAVIPLKYGTTLPVPTYAGYQFNGWYEAGTDTLHTVVPDSAVTLSAAWVTPYTNNVEYDTGYNSEGAMLTLLSVDYVSGTDAAVLHLPAYIDGRPVVRITLADNFYLTDALTVSIPATARFYVTVGECPNYSITFAAGSRLKTLSVGGNVNDIQVPETVEKVEYNSNALGAPYVTEFENGLYIGNSQNPHLVFLSVKSGYNGALKTAATTKVLAAVNNMYHGVTALTVSASVEHITPLMNGKQHTLQSITFEAGCRVTVLSNNPFGSMLPALTEITLHEGLLELGYRAIGVCYNLKSITIPSTVTKLGAYALANSAISAIHLPAGLVEITDNPFVDCAFLESITVDATNPVYTAKDGCLIDKTTGTLVSACIGATIPDDGSVIRIGKYATYYPHSYWGALDGPKNAPVQTTLVIPGSVRYMELWYDMYPPENLQYNEYENGLYLGNSENPYHVLVNVFDKSVTEFKLHPKTAIIAPGALSGLTLLRSITIPASVTCIGVGDFDSCTALNAVVFENTAGWMISTEQLATAPIQNGVPVNVSDAAAIAATLKSNGFAMER